MEKKSTKRRVIAISVLAALLVALLAFNVTYAYFTSKVDGSATINFGRVEVKADTAINISSTNVLPGQTVALAGEISTGDSTSNMWVKFSVPDDSIKLQYADKGGTATDIVWGTTVNKYFKDAEGGHKYTAADQTTMNNAVKAAVVDGLKSIIDKAATAGAASWKISDDGVTTIPVLSTATALNLANGGGFTLSGDKFGNLFQSVSIKFNIVIQAVQTEGTTADATNLTRAQALTAFNNTSFNAGTFTA